MIGDLLAPWLLLAAVIVPLIYTEKWIHSHLYGVGWLMTNDYKSATALYYVLLMPGVFVHEFTQYLMAGALNVKIKRVIAWPEEQKDGTLRLNFVQVVKANRAQRAIIGAVPLIVGLALVWLLSSRVLDLDNVISAIGTGDLTLIAEAARRAASAPDFFLWLYFIFTISNAMLPTSADREGWPLVLILFAGTIGFLVLIGVGDVLLETFTGPVAHGVEQVATAFATVLLVEVPGILGIGFLEEVLERTTKRKFEYNRTRRERQAAAARQPGSNLPLPPGSLLPSIYNLNLPLPNLSDVKASSARARRPAEQEPARTASPGTAAAPRPRAAFAPPATDTPRPEREPGSASGRLPAPRQDRPAQPQSPPPARTPFTDRPAQPQSPPPPARTPFADRPAQPQSPPPPPARTPFADRGDDQRSGLTPARPFARRPPAPLAADDTDEVEDEPRRANFDDDSVRDMDFEGDE
jgi:hypothetical protein